MELRPLDLAGIFDRAATLYSRAFPSFVAIATTAIVPVAVVQYFITIKEEPQLEATIRWLQQPPAVQAQHLPSIFTSPEIVLFSAISLVLGYALTALAVGAVGAGVARWYRGEPVAYAPCYRMVLDRWAAVLSVVALALAVAVSVNAVALAAVLLPLAALGAAAPALIVGAVPLGLLALLLAICVVLTMLLVIGSCAIYAAVLERCSPSAAMRLTLRRICNRREIGRAFLCASAVSIVGLVATGVADVIAFALLQRQPALYLALDTLARALVVPLVAIVFAVYYFDVRIRQEGFDLETRIDSLRVGEPGQVETAYASTRYLSGEQRELAAAFLSRRDALDEGRRREIAAHLVATFREHLPAALQRLDDEALLERL
jgi:hypothetical protein